jgi:hypothetical protein
VYLWDLEYVTARRCSSGVDCGRLLLNLAAQLDGAQCGCGGTLPATADINLDSAIWGIRHVNTYVQVIVDSDVYARNITVYRHVVGRGRDRIESPNYGFGKGGDDVQRSVARVVVQ